MRLNYALYALAAVLVLAGMASAATTSGASVITLSSPNVSTNAASTAIVGFNVNLTAGKSGMTYVTVTNYATLLGEGLNVTVSPSRGLPNYTGIVNVHTANSTRNGVYNVTLQATDQDPSHPATFKVMVGSLPSPVLSSTTTTGAITATTTTSAASQTTQTKEDYTALAVVIIIVIIVVAILRGRRMKK